MAASSTVAAVFLTFQVPANVRALACSRGWGCWIKCCKALARSPAGFTSRKRATSINLTRASACAAASYWPERGKLLFKTVACASCHKVGGSGGKIGPDLTAIGTTLSAERITEELLWPNRQVKEGYSVVRVITDAGKIHQGYQRKTKESEQSGDLVIQDLATGKLITIKNQQIDEQQTTGSVMPGKLTALLSQSQLHDLIQYLSELGRIK
ncbi:MAG TPA: c-type cytochrome [Planctomycetaceae bacterium]|nr:c-type cytochrome [Planctomycetaceae bacterium]